MSLLTVMDLLEDNSPKVATIHKMVQRRVLVLLPSYGINSTTVPDELDYIVDELAISRYNRIGSEGMTKESDNGYSVDYVADELANYAQDLTAYATKHSTAQPNGASSTKNKGWRSF